MKFVVSSSEFLAHLQTIGRVINSKNTIPILDSFLFTLDEDVLTIKASDSETTLITSMRVADAEGSGVFAIPAKMLIDPIRELPEQPLSIEVNDNNLEVFIVFQSGRYNLIGQSGETYPQLQEIKDNNLTIKMKVEELFTGVVKTLFATGADDLRPVMNGIFFDINPDSLTFVTTDSHKLVRFRNLNITSGAKTSFILPKKPAAMLKNILPKEDGEVMIQFDDRNAYFVFSNYKMVCRLIEGRYPNYNGVIPQSSPFKLIVDRQMFISALRRVSHFANSATGLVKLQIDTNQITISARDLDFSTAAEERLTCQYDSESISIGFKSSLLIDTLSNLVSSEVSFELTDASRAGVITPLEQNSGEDHLTLLMPMMLND
ncbi:MAG: DNA polymerase III subunit beta [Bacteroidales bacterium]